MLRRYVINAGPTLQIICNNDTKRRARNVREWMKLCLSASIPLMIGIFTVVTTIQQQKLSTQQREQDKQDAFLLRQHSERQADNLRKESVLNTYIDDVSNLLMLENRTRSLLHIRMKTLTSLRLLDSERKNHLFLFLYENQLIQKDSQQPISSLLKVDGTDFSGIYFQGTKDRQCSFTGLHLYGAHLSNSSFINCQLWSANFSKSIMYNTMFYYTDLRSSLFNLSSLNKANFSGTSMTGVKFIGASLIECDLSGARWAPYIDFTNANLTGSIISNEQLRNSRLNYSVLPDGTWGPINPKNLVVNGDVEQNCTTNDATNMTGWNVSDEGDIKVIAYKDENITEQFGECYFRLISFYNSRIAASTSQKIDLSTFSTLISADVARYNASVSCRRSGKHYGSIYLLFEDLKGLRGDPIEKSTGGGEEWQFLQLFAKVPANTRSVLIKIELAKTTTNSNNSTNSTIEESFCACDNVQFFITK